MKSLKITYVLPVYWPAIGGCELHTHEVVKRLSEKHEIKVITQITRQEDKPDNLWFGTLVYPIPKRERYFDNKANVIPININPLERNYLYPFVRYHHRMEHLSMKVISYVFQRKIFDLVKDSDLIHCIHNGASFYGYTALRCAKKLNIPLVFTPILHLYQENWQDHMKIDTEKGIKYSYSPRLNIIRQGYHDRFWLKVCENADALLTMTEFERNFFISLGLRQDRVYHVGVGPIVSESRNGQQIRKKYRIKENQIIVLFVGRKNEFKGIEELCRAAQIVWEKYNDVFFFFVGPSEGKAKEIFDRHRDNRIINIDNVSLDEKSDFLDSCDIFCMPSLHESLGGVFLEAWMFGKPIIGADIPPVRELTEEGKGGMLVNLLPEDIAEKIVTLIENKLFRHELGMWGKEKVISKYSWEIIVDKVEKIYKEIVK
jgi:glycosyltransferase involved in cell wall biosynthesis